MQRQFFFTKSIKISRFLLQKGLPIGRMSQKEGQQYLEIPEKHAVGHWQRFTKLGNVSSTSLILYRQQPSVLLFSIDIWPARNSRLTQREMNHYTTCCASVLAWSCLAGGSPEQLVVDLFAQHQRFAVCCQLSRLNRHFQQLACGLPTKNDHLAAAI